MRLATIGLAVILLAGDASAKLYEVTASVLNVRSAPTKSARVVKHLKKRTAIEVVEEKGSWKRIARPAQGWVHEKYVRSGLRRYVKAGAVNVRRGPGTGYTDIGTLKKRRAVRVVELKHGWRRISSPRAGWVLGKYLAKKPPSTAPNLGGPSRAGFLNLPTHGYGWTSYRPGSELWGTPRMIHGLIAIARKWKDGYPGVKGRTITVGGISRMNGGYFPPHQTHQRGVDVDLTPITRSGNASYSYYGTFYYSSNYSLYYSQRYARLQRSVLNVRVMLFNDRRISGTTPWSGHSNHFHPSIY